MNDDQPPEPLTNEELEQLPVFPLARVVFFPGTLLPLHLFEPRYRTMIEDCVTTGPRALAVALLEPGYESDYEGRPPIRSIAGVGRIIAHERNGNGTHDIVLHGLERVRLEELAPDKPYRQAKAIALAAEAESVNQGDILALLACAGQVAEVVRRKHPEFSLGVSARDPAAHVADTLADRFVADTDKRQAILEELNLPRRVALVTDAIGELLAMLASRDLPS
ncbi:MAG: LON peptidase substrate-binding domain-containing protein [Myxococcota bacterium]